MFKHINYNSLSLAFLIVGIPLLFVIRELLPINKQLFTYATMFLILLKLPNYKNLFKLRFNLSLNNHIYFITFFILALILFLSIFNRGIDSQSIYLFIIFYIFISLLTLKDDDKSNLLTYIVIISTISVYFTFLFTPLSSNYWVNYGGRLYIGDTENPNLVATLTSINIISTIYYLFTRKNIKKVILIFILPIFIMSPYLFFLSEGKSTFLGLLIVIIFVIFSNFNKILKNISLLIKFSFSFFIIFVISLVYFYEQINVLLLKVFSSFNVLMGNDSTVEARSAQIRRFNFEKSYEYLSLDNFFGYGINTFRMDSPLLQVNIDLGNIFFLFFLYLFILFPLFIILTKKFNSLSEETKIIFLIYLFNIPNFFFHGTPYEYSIWSPILLLLNINKKIKKRI